MTERNADGSPTRSPLHEWRPEPGGHVWSIDGNVINVRPVNPPQPTIATDLPTRSTMPDNPPTKATIIAATILCVGFALMLTLIGIAAIIWAL